MEYLKEYHSDNSFEEKNNKSPILTKKVNLAPVIYETEIRKNHDFKDISTKILDKNLPFDTLYAPVQGPKLPNKNSFDYQSNTLVGNVEKYSIQDFTFDEQYHTFKNFGYAKNPENFEDEFVGNKDNFSKFGGSTIFNENPLKKSKYRKRPREKSGDPGEIDTYKGPWAKYLDEEEEIEAIKERQKEMKELFEEKQSKKNNKNNKNINKNNDQNGKKSEKTPKKSENTEKTEKPENTEKTDQNDQKMEKTSEITKESTEFEYIKEFDYQGRTYMHCPSEFKSQSDSPHRCFIPSKHVHTWNGHTAPVTAIRWMPSTGHLLLSASMDKTVKIWDVNGHRSLLRTFKGHSKGVKDISFDNSGEKFLSVGHDHWTKLWDSETGQVVARFGGGVLSNCARFYPLNNNEFLSAQNDKLVVGRDVRSGEIIQKYDEHLRPVCSVVFIDQSRKFASSAEDKKILIWEYGIPVVVNHISEPYLTTVPYMMESPDGEWFLGQSVNSTIVAYNSGDKRFRQKRQYIGHNSYGYACQIDVSPDNKFLMSGDSSGKVVFWDWKNKKIYKRLKAHNKVTIGAIWHPVHPSKIATCSWDCTIKYWD